LLAPEREIAMLQATSTPIPVSTATRTDWTGFRHALARTLYALLLVLVMLLPANFIAAALATSMNHGDAFVGARYAAAHHLAGFWVVVGGKATAVTAGAWWATAVWEGLFWASCASGLALVGLWLGRALALRMRPRNLVIAWRDR
jgi:hypothetical protein